MDMPADHDYLLHYAQQLFPGTTITVAYDLDAEIIYLDVGDRRFTFEIGGDDDAYAFVAGDEVIEIPLMEIPFGNEDFT